MFFWNWADWMLPQTWWRVWVEWALVPVSYVRVVEHNTSIFQRRLNQQR